MVAFALVLCPMLAGQEAAPAPAAATAAQEPVPASAAKPTVPPGPKIIILKPTMRFEDTRSDVLIPKHAAQDSEYEYQLNNAARKSIGTRAPVLEAEKLDAAGAEACRQLQALASRLARGNVNEEVKEGLGRLAALDEEYIVLVQFFRLKTGPGGSWNPNTGAITSQLQSTLLQAALVHCKTGRVIWKGEQYLRKAVKATGSDFQKALALLYQDFDIK